MIGDSTAATITPTKFDSGGLTVDTNSSACGLETDEVKEKDISETEVTDVYDLCVS